MVYRIFVEKRSGLSPEANNLLNDLRGFLGIASLEGVRILNRYDVENIDPEVYAAAKGTVFSEPQVDVIYDETFPEPRTIHTKLAVEALPGQFDQRSDSCAQCIQLMAGVERPLVNHAKVYLLEGNLSAEAGNSGPGTCGAAHGSDSDRFYRSGRSRPERAAGRTGPCHGSG